MVNTKNILVVHRKNGVYDVYSRADSGNEKWILTRNSADNVIRELTKFKSIRLEFKEEDANE